MSSSNSWKQGLLSGKTAIVTGCNRGIGKAILSMYAEQGANLYAVIRKENSEFEMYCSSLEEKHGVCISICYADFSDEDAVKSVAKEILSEKQPIDVLVNNIGIGNPVTMFTMVDMKTVKEVFEINLFSAVSFTQAICRSMMKQKRGSILFLSSAAAFDGGMNLDYNASKAAVVGVMRSIAVQMGQFGIRANAIAPGLIDTELGDEMDESLQKITLSRSIMKRKGTPEEVAATAVFLGSEMSGFMTGQVLRVDGGML